MELCSATFWLLLALATLLQQSKVKACVKYCARRESKRVFCEQHKQVQSWHRLRSSLCVIDSSLNELNSVLLSSVVAILESQYPFISLQNQRFVMALALTKREERRAKSRPRQSDSLDWSSSKACSMLKARTLETIQFAPLPFLLAAQIQEPALSCLSHSFDCMCCVAHYRAAVCVLLPADNDNDDKQLSFLPNDCSLTFPSISLVCWLLNLRKIVPPCWAHLLLLCFSSLSALRRHFCCCRWNSWQITPNLVDLLLANPQHWTTRKVLQESDE